MPHAIFYLVLILGATLSCQAPAFGQSTIPLETLPPAPTNLQRLIELGEVTFEWGNNEEGRNPVVTVPEATGDGTSSSEVTKNLDAATRFRIAFDFERKMSWQLRRARERFVSASSYVDSAGSHRTPSGFENDRVQKASGPIHWSCTNSIMFVSPPTRV